MATIRWCPIYPKWDIYQSLSLKPPKHQAFFMTEVLRSPSMSTIGGFINSAVMRCSERGQPRNGGSCVHIKRYSYAIHIRSWFMFETIPGIPWNSIIKCWACRQDVRNQLVLETQHAGRWKLPSTAVRSFQGWNHCGTDPSRRQIEVMAAKNLWNASQKMYVQHGACQRKVAYLNCCKKNHQQSPSCEPFQDKIQSCQLPCVHPSNRKVYNGHLC